jgi:hypothetical protein
MPEQDEDREDEGSLGLEGVENKRRTFMKLAGGGAATAGLGSLTAIPVGAARTDHYCFQVDLVQNEAGNIRDPLDGNNKYNDNSRLIS